MLHVAAYDAAPFAARDAGGLFWGASVDLWRRVAEDRHWAYDLTLVGSMADVLDGVASGRFDVAIGAITITPGRLARVGFSYPTHRSGVAVAMARRSGIAAILSRYGTVVSRLGVLIALMLCLLLVTGVLIWLFERRAARVRASETSIGTVFEGLYWAVVTMTTVGYGDKAPRTHSGRAVAVAWMLGSLVLISLLSTSLVAQLTVDRLDDSRPVTLRDLVGVRRRRTRRGRSFWPGRGWHSLPIRAWTRPCRRWVRIARTRSSTAWARSSGRWRTGFGRGSRYAPDCWHRRCWALPCRPVRRCWSRSTSRWCGSPAAPTGRRERRPISAGELKDGVPRARPLAGFGAEPRACLRASRPGRRRGSARQDRTPRRPTR